MSVMDRMGSPRSPSARSSASVTGRAVRRTSCTSTIHHLGASGVLRIGRRHRTLRRLHKLHSYAEPSVLCLLGRKATCVQGTTVRWFAILQSSPGVLCCLLPPHVQSELFPISCAERDFPLSSPPFSGNGLGLVLCLPPTQVPSPNPVGPAASSSYGQTPPSAPNIKVQRLWASSPFKRHPPALVVVLGVLVEGEVVGVGLPHYAHHAHNGRHLPCATCHVSRVSQVDGRARCRLPSDASQAA